MHNKSQHRAEKIKRLKVRLEGVNYNIDLSIASEDRLTPESLNAIRSCIQFCVTPIKLCIVSGEFLDSHEVAEFSKLLDDDNILDLRLVKTNISLEQANFFYNKLRKNVQLHTEQPVTQSKPNTTSTGFLKFWQGTKPKVPSEKIPLLSGENAIPMKELNKK
jgi:hypothetical protein